MKWSLVILLFLPLVTFAAEITGPRDIEHIGCHRTDTTCYLTISGPAVGPDECQSSSIRWDIERSANGKAALTHLTSAFMGERKVTLKISNDCYSAQPLFPTFDYWKIE